MTERSRVAEPMREDWVHRVEEVIRGAHERGSVRLSEEEVYRILGEMQVRIPRYVSVAHENDITHDTLSVFSSERVVLKIVSSEVAHKQKAGGVEIVYRDLEFVKFRAGRMRERFIEGGVSVDGVLLVEHVAYSKNLGNEVLLGFRESRSFGPVISFSKGGTDAEHFAANFSPPNLILPPINREWAHALQASTHIQKKYLEEGKTDYISKIVDTEVKLSALATAFSDFFPSPARYVLTELEINPFVFDTHGEFVALDGYATFREKVPGGVDLTVRPQETLRPLFEPRGVAVIGVSATDNGKTGNIIVRNLLGLGRQDVSAVNIKGGSLTIDGHVLQLHKSVRTIESDVDLAIVTVPASATVAVVEDCARKGVKALLLIPGGFSEVTKNRDIEEQIEAIAQGSGMRVMGPNCLGVVYAGRSGQPGLNTFFIPEGKFRVTLDKERNVAILSQSGAMGITEIYNLRNAISPAVIVSYGNQLDVDPSDLVQYFQDDPRVDVIGLYIEGFRPGAGRKFFNVTAGGAKPVIVYKAGRTEAGQMATQSHTASISGEYAVAKAAMKQAGLIVADSMIDHGDLVKTFALLHGFPASGNRVAVIANAGYEKTYAADNLGDLVLAELREQTLEQLRAVIPPYVNAEPLLDLTAMISDEQFEQCIDIMLGSAEVDALCISIVPQAQVLHTTDQEIEDYEQNIAARIVKTVHRHRKPTVVSVNVVSGADAVYNRFGQVMDEGGVPTYLTAERAMVCLNAFIRYHGMRDGNLISEWLR